MKVLIPESILKAIPPLYSTQNIKDPLVRVKLFTPDADWIWFITEYDSENTECFGLVDGHEKELGYFYLTELQELRGPLGLLIERDTSFQPTLLSKLR